MTKSSPVLLPLGTAVRIKDDDSIYIIISRGFQKRGEETIAGYRGVPHPFGENSKYKTLVISSKAITEVVQRGYEDKLDEKFIDEQLSKVLDAPVGSTKKEPAKVVESAMPKTEVEVKTVPQSTPVKKETEHPYDPFYKLKHKRKEVKK
ncbi:DUF4176 domain-containing protein [Clostridium felsineum]|uniref:DUF4176 domain-containing protein n=1 Tax=Clostridium felsineum TaxID=36839 RepID=UPI00098C1E29|nr:DUF4176 domain-containing protein [Clostridium felsineum]MCR3761154.1 DUF4176 domain-containing protein [Clostridium felsineum]URZ14166.1 hypothetical protein CLFE_001510 [Clostridium felsineum DSM 794]